MGSGFESVGVLLRASLGRSLKIELTDLPFTVFCHNMYVSIRDVQAVLDGHKKTATLYRRKPRERPLSCEAHRS